MSIILGKDKTYCYAIFDKIISNMFCYSLSYILKEVEKYNKKAVIPKRIEKEN